MGVLRARVHGRLALRLVRGKSRFGALGESGFGERDRAAGGLKEFTSVHDYGYRISEKAAGRISVLLMFETMSASDSPGFERSLSHSGSDPNAFQALSRCVRSSKASM